MYSQYYVYINGTELNTINAKQQFVSFSIHDKRDIYIFSAIANVLSL